MTKKNIEFPLAQSRVEPLLAPLPNDRNVGHFEIPNLDRSHFRITRYMRSEYFALGWEDALNKRGFRRTYEEWNADDQEAYEFGRHHCIEITTALKQKVTYTFFIQAMTGEIK